MNRVANVVYIPSYLTVKLGHGEVLKPKVFTCSYTIWDLDYLRTMPSLLGKVPVNNSCYLLFFDHSPPAKNDEAEMNLNVALSSIGKRMDIPLIYFRKNVGLK